MLMIFAALVIILFVYRFLIIPMLEDDIYSEKQRQTEEMVDLGLSIFEHFHALEQQGLISEAEAQAEAIKLIRALKYGPRDLDYFWIVDYNYTTIVHPFRPDLEGKVLTDSEDQAELDLYNLFDRFIQLAREEGSGHLTYSWQYYDQADRNEEKLSFVAAYEPWGWIIGTGVYLSDLQVLIAQRSSAANYLLLLFSLAVAGIIYLFYKSRETKSELLESEEKYRIIAENTADAITVLDMDLKYRYVSPSIYKLQGFTPEEAMQRNLEQTLTPASLELALNTFVHEMQLIAEGKNKPDRTICLELEEYRKDGSTIWVENTLSFIKDHKDEPVGILTVSKDITERKRQQEALEKEQREKSMILENLAERVTYMDCDMKIIWTNRAAFKTREDDPERTLGLGRTCYEAMHNRSEPCAGCPVIKALQTGHITEGVIKYEDGRIWKMTGSPVFNDQGEIIGVLDTALDITDLKVAEANLKSLNEDLEKRVRERTAELSRANRELAAFTYSVSHDLRAPLRSINGFSEAVLNDYGDLLDQRGRNYLERVVKAGQRMNELIDDLLKLSRVTRQELHRDQVDLSFMVKAYALYLQEKEPDRQVNFNIEPGCTAYGDAALLRIALENLLDNAWKYTGGVEQAEISFGSASQNGQPFYYIQDNGIGFDPSYNDRIFDPFQRLHNSDDYPGTGVGLSIVQRIVERHDGEIWAEGKEGQGATFFFSIPKV